MLNLKFKRKTKNHKPLTLGLLVGVLAGITAVVLSDPQKRQQVTKNTKQVVSDTSHTVISLINHTSDSLTTKTNQLQKTLSDLNDKLDRDIAEIESRQTKI